MEFLVWLLKLSEVAQLTALLTYVTRKKKTKTHLETINRQPSTMEIVHLALQRKQISILKA